MAVLDACIALNQNPSFQPAMRVISAISNSNPVEITTIYDHQYSDGLIVRIDIPFADGMQELNQLFGTVTTTGDTTFTLPIDATTFDVFAIPEDPLNPGYPPPGTQVCAMAVPIGEDNATIYQATRNVLPL